MSIYVGIGGWDFDPWRGTFYPPGLAKTKQLEFAGSKLTAIEINATYYKLQKPELFERWGKTVPDGFKFAIKASRFCSNRRILGEAGEAIGKFCAQGFTELGDKLGPILWQLMGTKQFDPDDIRAFLALLPKSQDGIPLRHAIEPRHESFRTPEFVELCRAAGVAIVFEESEAYPCIADLSGDFTYARLQKAREAEPIGYTGAELDHWAGVAKAWSRGESPDGLCYSAEPIETRPRDTFVFFISGDKIRNPAAAMALIARL
jgi:uncharacterized protein YecE (DUF72 family)